MVAPPFGYIAFNLVDLLFNGVGVFGSDGFKLIFLDNVFAVVEKNVADIRKDILIVF